MYLYFGACIGVIESASGESSGALRSLVELTGVCLFYWSLVIKFWGDASVFIPSYWILWLAAQLPPHPHPSLNILAVWEGVTVGWLEGVSEGGVGVLPPRRGEEFWFFVYFLGRGQNPKISKTRGFYGFNMVLLWFEYGFEDMVLIWGWNSSQIWIWF